MRTDREFVEGYRRSLLSIDPAAGGLDIGTVRSLALTELCLHFLAEHLPDENVSAVPYLMLGYPSVLNGVGDRPDVRLALASMRHLCSRYISVAAWLDACRQHGERSETIRCYNVVDRKPLLRNAASATLRTLLDAQLGRTVPWVERKLSLADPGEALVRVNRGDTVLSYRIPTVPEEQRTTRKHALTRRRVNPPIRVTLDQMMAAAKLVDERESQEDWPSSLPRLRLSERLQKLAMEGLLEGFFVDRTIALDGAVHVVGMLSSGKSTLAWALVFALTLGGSGKRIAMLVTDTIQGATLVARLRRHGVAATVLSSLYNRDRHLNSIHWQQGLSSGGWSLACVGDIAQNFSVACPLDGMQREPAVVRGNRDSPQFPQFKEKQCHRLYQKAEDADWARNDDAEDYMDDGGGRSCPLWACCPAQDQQRSAVDAQVIALTPQALVHMTPDKWTAGQNLTIPELLQYVVDLVIVDEVDSVQKTMDDIFAPRSPIMGDERDVYAPAIGTRSSEALRERSGVQFRREVNAKWQANFHTLYRLIGALYAILQNEQSYLRPFYRNTPFTAASILYEVWRRRQEVLGLAKPGRSFDDPAVEEEFLEVIKVASGISRFSRASSISVEEAEEQAEEDALRFRDDSFRRACEALQGIAREVSVADYYDRLIGEIEEALDGDLQAFRAVGDTKTKRDALSKRANALALLLAVVTDMVLSHYYWLVKTQPAVATDFGIDDDQLFSQANNLIKHYRTLLPSNPAGAVFGLLYDEPADDKRETMGGKLTLINHLGVGRHLIVHLHNLLAAEGQAGPHVLMLSGTSWAGGSAGQLHPKTGRLMDAASPSFDVQVPVKGVLRQPQAELEAIGKSVFELVSIRDSETKQVRVSGLPERDRRRNLALISERLAARRDDTNMIEDNWRRMEAAWGATEITGRRRSLLVTNSYADAVVVADALLEALEGHGYADWKVFCLVRDRADDGRLGDDRRPKRARELPRSLIERFGDETEKSVLVAPMQIVSRGHNILNESNRAAISSIYFLHRPHPRPDDLSPAIGRLNRYAIERFDNGVKANPKQPAARLSQRARRMRYAATNIVRYSLYSRGGYSELSTEYKVQFAWDMLTPLWQTVGRGIRNGCPVFIGFVDRQFAPQSFDGGNDTGDTSALVQAVRQLEKAMDAKLNKAGHAVARLLYEPFHDALSRTKGLSYV